ncbi:uncharacterized protein LOC134246255 [Saccostrea cucullata]|uniref:uncharacterized protein LOC134246255 n=1 Tax=Saccostrea cuccullata TaxID=36930 RepID=UPI002ED17E4C
MPSDRRKTGATSKNRLRSAHRRMQNKVRAIMKSESNYEDISLLRQENAQLRRELELLQSVVIRMERKMSVIEDGVTDLRSRKLLKQPLPFFNTTQQPASIVSARNKVFDTAECLHSQNITVKIQKNQVILPNGSRYKDDVPFLTNADALLVTPEETEHLDSVEIKNSDPIKKDSSEFMAFGARVKTVDGVKNMYSKVLIDPYAASADNRILVYRFSTEDCTVHEN